MASPTSTTTTTSAVAFRLLIISFILVSTLFTTCMSSRFDCTPEHGCYYVHTPVSVPVNYPNRKILMGVSKAKALDSQRPNYGMELRNVPSGPDPLHHNGGPQKRPRISP